MTDAHNNTPIERHAVADAESPPGLIFETNLSAISQRHSALAGRLRLAPQDTVRFRFGRDGTLTAQVRDAAGQWQWIGATSAPSVSSGPVTDQPVIEPVNVAVLGAGSGWELGRLLARLQYQQALFCVIGAADGLDGEQAAAAALRLVDLSALIESHRLVFVAAEGVGAIGDFLAANPGYDPPRQVVRWPWQSAEQFAAATAMLDRAGAQRMAAVKVQTESLAAQFATWSVGAIERVLGFAPAREDDSRLAVQSLARAAGGRCVLIHGADGAAPTTKSQAIADAQANLVVSADRIRGEFSPAPPGGVRFATWLTEARSRLISQPGRWVGRLGESDFVFVADKAMAAALVAAGAPADRVRVLPAATDADVFAPVDSSPTCDVLLVGDLPLLDADDLRIELPTHRKLWQAWVEQVLARPADYEAVHAEQSLERAGQRCGVSIADARLRGKYLDAIRLFAGAGVLRRCAAQSLRGAGSEFRVCGDGWAGQVEASRIVPVPGDWAGWRALFGSARLVAFADDPLEVSPGVLNAAACECVVAVRVGRSDAGIRPFLEPGREVIVYRDPADLPTIAANLASAPAQRARIGKAARERVLRDHTFSRRWVAMREAIEGGSLR